MSQPISRSGVQSTDIPSRSEAAIPALSGSPLSGMKPAPAEAPRPSQSANIEASGLNLSSNGKTANQLLTDAFKNGKPVVVAGYSPTGGGHTARMLNPLKNAVAENKLDGGVVVLHVPKNMQSPQNLKWVGAATANHAERPGNFHEFVEACVKKGVTVVLMENDKAMEGHLKAGFNDNPASQRALALTPERPEARYSDLDQALVYGADTEPPLPTKQAMDQALSQKTISAKDLFAAIFKAAKDANPDLVDGEGKLREGTMKLLTDMDPYLQKAAAKHIHGADSVGIQNHAVIFGLDKADMLKVINELSLEERAGITDNEKNDPPLPLERVEMGEFNKLSPQLAKLVARKLLPQADIPQSSAFIKALGGHQEGEQIAHVNLGQFNTLTEAKKNTQELLGLTEDTTPADAKSKMIDLMMSEGEFAPNRWSIGTDGKLSGQAGPGKDNPKPAEEKLTKGGVLHAEGASKDSIKNVVFLYARDYSPGLIEKIKKGMTSGDAETQKAYQETMFVFGGKADAFPSHVKTDGNPENEGRLVPLNPAHAAYLTQSDTIMAGGAGTTGEVAYLNKAGSNAGYLMLPQEGQYEQNANGDWVERNSKNTSATPQKAELEFKNDGLHIERGTTDMSQQTMDGYIKALHGRASEKYNNDAASTKAILEAVGSKDSHERAIVSQLFDGEINTGEDAVFQELEVLVQQSGIQKTARRVNKLLYSAMKQITDAMKDGGPAPQTLKFQMTQSASKEIPFEEFKALLKTATEEDAPPPQLIKLLLPTEGEPERTDYSGRSYEDTATQLLSRNDPTGRGIHAADSRTEDDVRAPLPDLIQELHKAVDTLEPGADLEQQFAGVMQKLEIVYRHGY